MNLITDPVFTLPGGNKASFPALFAAMAQGEVPRFPALRPHQRPAWHMFLVQLGALALWRAGCHHLPRDEGRWRDALRAMTPDHPDDAPWRLVVEQRERPAFMQPPDPGGLKWSNAQTPDALDMLITSRNHDLKQAVAKHATPEDWIFALVSLQTCEGYGGRGNQGIARMNGGSSSRPMLGLVPISGGATTVNASHWWARDTRLLLARRAAGQEPQLATPGGKSLLWLLSWPEGSRLDLRTLDPWFIEICRRIRLVEDDGAICAQRGNSTAPRIDAKAYKGNVGDPWAPVNKGEGKSLTISGRGFDYKRICELLHSGDWEVPYLAKPQDGETDDMLLVAEAICRGNSKTEGFKSRAVPVPGKALPFYSSATLGTLAEAQAKEIDAFDKALRNALALMAARGKRDALGKKHYAYTNQARRRFDHVADGLFFPSLWRRLTAASLDSDTMFDAKLAFLVKLKKAADQVLDASLPTIPCTAIFRARAAARARRAFTRTLRYSEACRDLFEKEETDDAA